MQRLCAVSDFLEIEEERVFFLIYKSKNNTYTYTHVNVLFLFWSSGLDMMNVERIVRNQRENFSHAAGKRNAHN